ncbi:hypothetical protein D8Y20_08940 [Mariprofundus sp. EBB-1]|uniref:hypothetical protein n=1 Tax=Mariprofundus sp. EBB-1 TaxID=2650971 RepID=UPI000EF1ECE3|nr:hypothetical protein [Mariprofundus sp. EBB-1]RLL51600.1 hypothetical protein D8Y20_08940 [Mariprofundus sp. EBB-1]
MMVFKKMVSIVIACSVLLSGCATGTGGSPHTKVGPQPSSAYDKTAVKEEVAPAIEKPKLDIIVPVFDPGLPDDPEDYEAEGVWPELRRAEASRFAYQMKLALEETGAFGAVRVMPDSSATGDLYVVGKINKSNGVDIDIDINVSDISGKKWFDKSFDHEVAADFYNNIRNKGKDPYAPVFKEAAEKLVEALNDHKDKQLTDLQALTDLRFGANFSDDAFSRYMRVKGNKFTLLGYPDANDSMLRRVKAIRVRDQLFIDRMQPHYEQFNQKMETSYALWQKQSFEEVKAAHKAKMESISNAAAGIGLIALAVLSAVAGGNSNSTGGVVAGTTGAIVAGQVGMGMLGSSVKMNEESKFHRDALIELGQSIEGEMAPQVVEHEQTTAKLTGSAKQQFSQWRAFLKRMFEQEATPDVQL